jgi:hypothetical protein
MTAGARGREIRLETVTDGMALHVMTFTRLGRQRRRPGGTRAFQRLTA